MVSHITILCDITGFGMSSVCNAKNRSEGFTLIELLLAIFIFGIVISVVYGSYSSTFHLINSTDESMMVAGKARVVLERITDDLSSIVVGNGGFLSGLQQENPGGRGDNLTFVSAVHLGLTRDDDYAGYSVVQYSAEPDEKDNLLKLYRSGNRIVPGENIKKTEARKYLLCDGLQEVRFSYFNDEGIETDDWQYDSVKKESENNGFPVMVTVVLRFAESIESEDVSVFTAAVALPQGK